jgi:hypothetical protein
MRCRRITRSKPISTLNLEATGIRDGGKSPLFRSAVGRTGTLTATAMNRVDASFASVAHLQHKNIKEAWDSDIPVDPKDPHRAPIPGAGQIEFEIKSKIYCELKKAVQAANYYYVDQYRLPKDWLAQVSLSLEVDESSALNPGVAFNTPMANAISTFGVVTTSTLNSSALA